MCEFQSCDVQEQANLICQCKVCPWYKSSIILIVVTMNFILKISVCQYKKNFTSVKNIFLKRNMNYILCCSDVTPTGVTQTHDAVHAQLVTFYWCSGSALYLNLFLICDGVGNQNLEFRCLDFKLWIAFLCIKLIAFSKWVISGIYLVNYNSSLLICRYFITIQKSEIA